MDTQAIIKQLAGMLCGFPDLTQSPEETAKSYLEALEGLPGECVSAAISAFLVGRVEGYNPAFRPSPPQIATEARRLRDIDLDRINRERKAQKQIEARPGKYSERELRHRRDFIDGQLGKLNLSFPNEKRSVPFTDMPQDQAVADLEALRLKKQNRTPVEVSPVLAKQYQPKE